MTLTLLKTTCWLFYTMCLGLGVSDVSSWLQSGRASFDWLELAGIGRSWVAWWELVEVGWICWNELDRLELGGTCWSVREAEECSSHCILSGDTPFLSASSLLRLTVITWLRWSVRPFHCDIILFPFVISKCLWGATLQLHKLKEHDNYHLF